LKLQYENILNEFERLSQLNLNQKQDFDLTIKELQGKVNDCTAVVLEPIFARIRANSREFRRIRANSLNEFARIHANSPEFGRIRENCCLPLFAVFFTENSEKWLNFVIFLKSEKFEKKVKKKFFFRSFRFFSL